MSTIAENIAAIRARIDAAARTHGPHEAPTSRSWRNEDERRRARVRRKPVAARIDACGGNRVREMTEKLARRRLPARLLHFISHLQTNKVQQVVGRVDLIQSVDSRRSFWP